MSSEDCGSPSEIGLQYQEFQGNKKMKNPKSKSSSVEGKSNANKNDSHGSAQYENKKVPELKQLLKARGANTTGTKAELVERLMSLDCPITAEIKRLQGLLKKISETKDQNDDSFLKECFFCDKKSDVPFENKLKDARICNECKNDPKKQMLTMAESQRIFRLPKATLQELPHMTCRNYFNHYYLYKIETLAKTCILKYGSLKLSRDKK